MIIIHLLYLYKKKIFIYNNKENVVKYYIKVHEIKQNLYQRIEKHKKVL